MANPIREIALTYGRRSWQVVPLHTVAERQCSCGKADCKSSGKHPRTWGGLREASSDESQIQGWFDRWTNSNIGIVTGEGSGLVVVDIDPRHGGDVSWAELVVLHGQPRTVEVVTGSGGSHYYFRHPGRRIGNTSNKLGAGIDTHGDGGYVVAPGSRHASGEEYRWAMGASPDEVPLAPMPDWLLDRLEKPKQPEGVARHTAVARAPEHDFEDDITLPAAKIEPVLGGCAWIRHTRDDAAELQEPEWYAMLSILGRCEDGERLAQEWSQPHAGYTPHDTAAKLKQALVSAGPRTCQDIAQNAGDSYCSTCPHQGAIKSPIVLGRQEHLVDAGKALRQYGLKVDGRRYVLAQTGVYPVRYRDGAYKPDWSKPIAARPIYPSAHGIDLATGSTWIQLSWLNSRGQTATRWLPDTATNDRAELLGLNDAPVSLGRINPLSDWLADSKAWVAEAPRSITTRLGWVGQEGDRRFILPGHPEVEYIGPDLGSTGSIEGWATPLNSILALGKSGYLALSVVGLSAAAPMVRLLGKRNPVIGLVAESSQGKGTIINYALAIWGPPSALTVPAGSTVKGLQDRGINSPDLPLFADEIQQLLKTDPRRVEDAIYYLGNGQRRVTSSKSQVAVGGERRYGIGFYAAEEPITQALQLGAQYRVIELDGAPMASEAQAIEVQATTQNNYGMVGRELAVRAFEDRELAPRRIRTIAEAAKAEYPGIKGEDSYSLSLIACGLDALAAVTGLGLPTADVVEWLAAKLDQSRAQTIDRHTAAWQALVESIQGFGQEGDRLLSLADINPDVSLDRGLIIQHGHYVAWRGKQAEGASGGLEINPRAPMVESILRPYGGGAACSRIWAARGWLERQGETLTCKKRFGGKIVRVWRVTAEGVQAAGFDLDTWNTTWNSKTQATRAS